MPCSRRPPTSPSRTTIIRSAGESSTIKTSPAPYSRNSICEASQLRSSALISENTGTAASCCTRSVVGLVCAVMSHLRKITMHELNGDGTFADTGGHAFYRAIANIAHGKNAGHAGFEEKRVPVQEPAGRQFAAPHRVGSGKHESARIPLDETIEPFRARFCPDEDEQRVSRYFLDSSGTGAGN